MKKIQYITPEMEFIKVALNRGILLETSFTKDDSNTVGGTDDEGPGQSVKVSTPFDAWNEW